jgi:hypothetical protein
MPRRHSPPHGRPSDTAATRAQVKLLHADSDRLTITWAPPPLENVATWQIICFDGGDRAIARLQLRPRRRPRASFTGLAVHAQPFTVAISAVAADGTITWQAGLGDLALPEDRQIRHVDVSTAQKPSRPQRPRRPKRRE